MSAGTQTSGVRAVSTVEQALNGARLLVKQCAEAVGQLADGAKTGALPPEPGENRGEMIANLMLAYRHLEDASMRVGKAIQAHNGGASVYDRATTVGA